jgi:hypothetical protein
VAPVLPSRGARNVSDAETSAATTTRPFPKRIAAGVYAKSRQERQVAGRRPEMTKIFQGSSQRRERAARTERVRSAAEIGGFRGSLRG